MNETWEKFGSLGEYVAVHVGQLIFGVMALLGNGVIFAVIWRYEAFRKDSPGIYLIALLAVTDALTGLGGIIVVSERLRRTFAQFGQTKAECILKSAPQIMGLMASQLALCCIAMDRYFAVTDPLGYKARPGRLRAAVKQAAAITLVTTLVTASFFIGIDPLEVIRSCSLAAAIGKLGQVLWVLFTLGVIIFIIIMYIILLVLVRKKLSAAEHSQSVYADNLRIQAKVTRLISIVLAVYIALFATPALILDFVFIVSPSLVERVSQVGGVLIGVSCAANIFIYSARLPEFAVYFRKFFGWFSCSNNAVIPL